MANVVSTATRRAAAVAAAALTLLGTVPRPTDGDLVGMALPWLPKVRHASTSVRSFRITLTTSHGDRLVEIMDAPRRYWLIATRGGERTETYFIGRMMYDYRPGQGWVKVDTVRLMRLAAAHGFHRRKRPDQPKPVVRNLPDRYVNGVLMGVVRFTSRDWFPLHRSERGKLVTMTCLYTKEGGVYRSCSVGKLYTLTFDHYDDAANHFVVPQAALDAPPAPWLKE